ncbi:GNAT family N-acetyltransferase [Enterovibrio baiacu]|uniref:GNAT family N-acetyltransferase n=1 Tax=Enterovibrio baiacu TaxID=2491023 RepID=UPI003D11344D
MIEESDLSFVKEIRLDETTSCQLGTFLFTNDYCQRKWFEQISSKTDMMFLIFEKQNLGNEWESIGYVRLTDIDRINLSVCIGADVHMSFRGKGFGTRIYELVFKLCFNNWNMNRLWLLVIDYNETALALYKKVGFTEEGAQRQAIYRNGLYHNYVMMSLLKEEYTQWAK